MTDLHGRRRPDALFLKSLSFGQALFNGEHDARRIDFFVRASGSAAGRSLERGGAG